MPIPKGYTEVTFKLAASDLSAKTKSISTVKYAIKDGASILTSKEDDCHIKNGKIYNTDGKEIKSIDVSLSEILALGQMDVAGKKDIHGQNIKDGVIDQKDGVVFNQNKKEIAEKMNAELAKYGGNFRYHPESQKHPALSSNKDFLMARASNEGKRTSEAKYHERLIVIWLPGEKAPASKASKPGVIESFWNRLKN